MKKYCTLILAIVIAMGLCACRFGGNTETTTQPTVPATTEELTMPSIINPTIMDPIETNVPDTNVDDDHLVEPSQEDGADMTTPDIRKRIN